MEILSTKKIIVKSINYIIFGISIAIMVNFITNDTLSFEELLSICVFASLIYACSPILQFKDT